MQIEGGEGKEIAVCSCVWAACYLLPTPRVIPLPPHYSLQHILEHGRPEHRGVIIEHIKGRVLPLAQHKFASNVIERALEYGSASEKRALVDEIVNPSVALFHSFQGMPDEASGGPVTPLQVLMRDPFGNYVVPVRGEGRGGEAGGWGCVDREEREG